MAGSPSFTASAQDLSIDPSGASHDHSLCT